MPLTSLCEKSLARAAAGSTDSCLVTTDETPETQAAPDAPQDFRLETFPLLDESRTAMAEKWVAVQAAVQRELFGDKGSAWTLDELRAFHRKTDKKRVNVAAWVGDEVVGTLEVMMPLLDNESVAMLWLNVLAGHRGRGIGSALLAEAERIGAEHGRTTFMGEAEWAEGAADLSESWATKRGYASAQVVLRSEMAFPADRVALESVLAEPGAEDYVIESFVDEAPEAWLDDLAVLQVRMSTDAPQDDLDYEEEVWDAERLREQLDSVRQAGRRIVETVARHVPTGQIVAFTQITTPPSEPELGYQQDTLVLKEHRGHALGLRLKAANGLLLMDELPHVRTVRTWNAASNEHMLAVNRRLGYVVDGYSREWQKQV